MLSAAGRLAEPSACQHRHWPQTAVCSLRSSKSLGEHGVPQKEQVQGGNFLPRLTHSVSPTSFLAVALIPQMWVRDGDDHMALSGRTHCKYVGISSVGSKRIQPSG